MASTALDLRDRAALFTRLTGETFDVLVIGGGITGAGIVRDAAMRGLRVALIEAYDFGAGTSSRSTKLVHGGLRYLAQGDVGLVREAASERAIVKQIAPHLAAATPVIVGGRSRAHLATLRAGLWTYEKLGGVAAAERHEVWDRARLQRDEPALMTDTWAGAVVYAEYITDDARLTLANVRSAASHGAVVANHAAVTAFVREGSAIVGVAVTDTLGGDGGQTFTVRGRVIVNATGPWADRLRALEAPRVPAWLQLTKGVHLVVPRARLQMQHMAIVDAADGRGVFIVPRGDYVYIGTTDTFYPQPEYWPGLDAQDVAYVLDSANRNIRGKLHLADVVASWAGLRPLVSQPGKAPSEISRRDETTIGPGGVVTIAGGKLTAFRRMAERVIDLCETRLGRARPTKATTAREPLPGGDGALSPDQLRAGARQMGLDASQAERLARLYGSEALQVLARGVGAAGEAEHAVLIEGALTLEDWWVRRSSRAWFDGAAGALPQGAARMATLLGWSEAETARQIALCRTRVRADAGERPPAVAGERSPAPA